MKLITNDHETIEEVIVEETIMDKKQIKAKKKEEKAKKKQEKIKKKEEKKNKGGQA